MVPLVNSRADAERAVAACKYPPDGGRSIAYPVRAVYKKFASSPSPSAALADYLSSANRETEVWLQVETRRCYEALDDVLSVPGVSCAFLGPADLGFSFGLYRDADFDLSKILGHPKMDEFHGRVLEACRKHDVAAGTFCVGKERAAALAAMGFRFVGFDTDLNALISYAGGVAAEVRSASASSAAASAT